MIVFHNKQISFERVYKNIANLAETKKSIGGSEMRQNNEKHEMNLYANPIQYIVVHFLYENKINTSLVVGKTNTHNKNKKCDGESKL